MSAIIRYTLVALGAVLVLLLAATLAVLLLVNPEDYREEIVAALSEETGRPVSLEGELNLGVLPCCSLQLGRLAAGPPADGDAGDEIAVEGVNIRVQLWPLVARRELLVEQVAAERVSLDTIELLDVNFSGIGIAPGQTGDVRLELLANGIVPDQSLPLKLQGKVFLDGETNQAELRDLDIELDQSTITGWLRLSDPQLSAVEFELAVDRLDADRYLGDTEEESSAADTGSVNDTRIDIPVQALRDARLNGSLAIGELVFSGAQLKELDITVAAADGTLRLHPLTARLYGGSYAGDVRLDVRGTKPKLSVNEQLENITLAALLSDTRGAANLSGSGNVGIKASASGDTVGELLERLSGNASFALSDGIYKGVDLWYEIRRARALIKKAAVPEKPADPHTAVSEFSGTLQFAGGQVNNPDFRAAIPFMRLTGNGSFNLLSEAVDYTLQARVIDTPTFGEGEELDKLEGLTLPVRITGTASEPKVKVDLGELVKDAAKDAVKDKVRERLRKKFRLFD